MESLGDVLFAMVYVTRVIYVKELLDFLAAGTSGP